MYEFESPKFSGPLEKLLELIEDQKLGIDDVSLAKVTDSFLKYLDDFRNGELDGEAKTPTVPLGHLPLKGEEIKIFRQDLRVLADFIAIASRLILLKSKYLLPGLALTGEEETEIKDLETRLARYQQLRPAIHALAKLWRESHKSYSRPYFLGRGNSFAAEQNVFYPGPNAGTMELRESIQRVFDTIVKFEMETETIKEKIVTLEEKIKEVMGRVTIEGDTHFKALSSKLGDGGASRAEMVIVFLALLHLAREQLVRLEQVGQFSDIMIRKNDQIPMANDQLMTKP